MLLGLNSAGTVSFYEGQLRKFGAWITAKMGSVLLAFLFIAVGMKLSKWLCRLLKTYFQKTNLDQTVSSFLLSVIHILTNALVIITAATIMGFQVTSFITLLGTAGVTIGLALQGSLSNFAGGMLILILKPFVIGDYIKEDTKGNEGTVVGIDIFYTRIRTFDNKIVVIPNGVLSNTSLTNLTKEKKRRLDLEIPISYTADIRKVRQVLTSVIENETGILKTESKDIIVQSFEDSSILMGVRVWVATENYWNVRFRMLENIKEAFDDNEIEIPYNQLDVILHGNKEV